MNGTVFPVAFMRVHWGTTGFALGEHLWSATGAGTPKRTRELRFRVVSTGKGTSSRRSILATNAADSPWILRSG